MGGRAADGAGGLSRHLEWEGCFNVRDLGGLPTRWGSRIRHGAVVRADALDRLTASGWASVAAHGVRTVIDLRNDDERSGDLAPRPGSITTLHLPLDGAYDHEFWVPWRSGPQFATPLYYRSHLDRFPEHTVRVLAAVAAAAPGGVAIHCVGGRDRTGQVTMMLLALAGVPAHEIAADYALSAERLRVAYAARGERDQGVETAEYLAARGTSSEQELISLLCKLDVEEWTREHGLSEAELCTLRVRVVDRHKGRTTR